MKISEAIGESLKRMIIFFKNGQELSPALIYIPKTLIKLVTMSFTSSSWDTDMLNQILNSFRWFRSNS